MCVHPKNPIILTNLGEPIPTHATFKGQVQKACAMWPQVKGALVKKKSISHLPTPIYRVEGYSISKQRDGLTS